MRVFYGKLPLGLIFLMILTFKITACVPLSEKMKQSPNFNNGHFHNFEKTQGKSLWNFIKTRLTTEWADWPDHREFPKQPQPPKSVGGEKLRVTYINHATLLIQAGGLNILTDPHFSERCSPVQFAGPKRVHSPGVPFEELPKIDVVLISHDHYDHLDLPTIEKLVKRNQPQFFVGLGVKSRFNHEANVTELDWWESTEVTQDLKIHFVEVQHFSGRLPWDRNSTLWGGFVIELAGHKIYFGGDSGYGGHYLRTYERFGHMDLSLLPIGAYAPRDFMGPVHVDPEQAVQAHQDLKSKKSIGMHFGTFQLTAEEIDEPLRLLKTETKKAGLAENSFITLKPGQSVELTE
jgi:L-ascorbate metabolism protein UlaG (beta-lactamase superfamily)